MAKTVLKVDKFLGFTDLPNYNRDPGWLDGLNNYRIMPGGYMKCRAGFEQLKPSGGTASDAISAGIYTGGHEHIRPDAYVVRYDATGAVYSNDLSQFAYFNIWRTTAATFAANDAIYIGADAPFSRVVFYIGEGTYGNPTDPTFLYEFSKTGWSASAAGGTLTLTSTPAFETPGEQLFEWQMPTIGGAGWVPMSINGIYAYWVRIRVNAANNGVTTAVTQSTQRIYTDSVGARQIWVSGADATAGAASGVLKFWGQSDATTAAWTSVSTALFSGNYARHRFASYKNLIYVVNGKEQKRYSGAAYAAAAYNTHALNTMGFAAPTTSGAALASPGTGLTGVFKYAITYGYGPSGEWGESNETAMGTAGTTAVPLANQNVQITFNLTSIPDPGIADLIYVYRTADLTSVPLSAQTSFPMYRIATVTRTAAGVFPTTYTDGTLAFPFPPTALDVAVNTPPVRCRYITLHKNRLFLASNNQYPGRAWWSDPFEAESFNQDENYSDFTRSTGGRITGMVEFNDQVVVFTEDQMFGIANVDEDIPAIYVIGPGVGCIAPDSVAVAHGVLCWLARDGVYLWDGQTPQVGSDNRISNDVSATFGKMSTTSHGGSRAGFWDRMYCVTLINGQNSVAVAGTSVTAWRYDLVTKSWTRTVSTMTDGPKYAPLTTFLAPVGHADSGVRHLLYGVSCTGNSTFHGYVGDYGSLDEAATITATGRVHFGPKGWLLMAKQRCMAIYTGGTAGLADSTAQLGFRNPPSGGSIGATTPEAGADYSKIEAYYPSKGSGSADNKLQFTATSADSTHELYAMYLEGDVIGTPHQNA